MNIVKSLHSSLIYKCFSHQEKHFFTVSVLWGFNLITGEPVLEQNLWQTISETLSNNDMFDTGMPKPNAELLVQGSCFAPKGEAINASRVTVSLGELSKELMVFGDRHWIKGLGVAWGVSDPEPFTEMPISYTNAFGGKDHAPNPAGKGLDEVDGDVPLPNIEYADQLIGSPSDKPYPASLSRIDMMCEQRRSYAGTYDQKYIKSRMPGFPDDLDYRFFNDAARDQWHSGYFNGDELYEIHNMNPDHPVIKGQIPGVCGRAFVNHQVNGEVEFREIPTKLDTIWFFPTAETGVLIHRGVLEVNEDDASDIKQILTANENMNDVARSPEHYKNELALRTDPRESYKYLMYTAPLIPEGVTCGFKVIEQREDFPLEMLVKTNMENYTEGKNKEAEAADLERIEEARKQLADSGMDEKTIDDTVKQLTVARDRAGELSPEEKKINEIMEKVIPGMTDSPANLDLTKIDMKAMDELSEYTEKLNQDKKNENRARLLEQLDEMKKNARYPQELEAATQLEKFINDMDLPAVLPRIDIDKIMNQLKAQQEEMQKQLLTMQSMGMSDDDLKQLMSSIKFDDAEKQLREGLDSANTVYREGAHYIESARSPHEGQEGDIREALIKAYKSGGKTSHGDYAFVDLSDLDLTGIDLSGSYLEYANLSNTNLSNANLSKAILAHANLNNTILSNANLTEANLGSIVFEGAIFTDTDLTGAILGKSTLNNTQFNRCKMAEKLDMFFEAKFNAVSFNGSDMRKNAFIDADISLCDFSNSDLSGASFVNPIMKNTIFNGANLSGVNFVKASADGSKFDNAIMKNVRFVAECSLNDATFHRADIPESNFRDCGLRNAVFDEANLFKTDFSGANLNKASFKKARAVESQFSKADLENTQFDQANIFEGSMLKARILSTSFYKSNLYGVNFLGCTVGDTDFAGADLTKTIFEDWRP